MAKTASNFMYTHRLMRVWNYLHSVETKRRSDLFRRSSMMCAALSLSHAGKLEIEAGTLSYLPQFSLYKKGELAKRFGNDVAFLVGEVNELRELFAEGTVDISDIRGTNLYAKSVYAYQAYVDIVIAFSSEKGKFTIDGEEFTYKDDKVKAFDELHPIPEFHGWLMETLKWKLDLLKYVNSDIEQALREVVKQYKEQKGFMFNLDLTFCNAETDESPVTAGHTG